MKTKMEYTIGKFSGGTWTYLQEAPENGTVEWLGVGYEFVTGRGYSYRKTLKFNALKDAEILVSHLAVSPNKGEFIAVIAQRKEVK